MITDLYITNSSGDTLQLNLRSSLDDHGLLIFNLTGLGSPKATASGLEGPTYDGITGYFVRADARSMQLTLAIPTKSTIEEAARNLIYEYFIVKEEITFRVVTDSKDVSILAIVESVEMNHFSKVVNAVISLYSPDPYFIDKYIDNPWGYYYNTISGWVTDTIHYDGTANTGTKITLNFGEDCGTWINIFNDRGNAMMSLDLTPIGGGIGQGDKIVIDTRKGQKSIKKVTSAGAVTDMLDCLVIGVSKWIELYPGDNNITVTYDQLGGTDPNMPSASNMVSMLPMDEGDYGIAHERKFGRNFTPNTGTAVGYDTGHKYDLSREFIPGLSPEHYLYYNATQAFSFHSSFTICGWIKPKTFGLNYRIVVGAMDDWASLGGYSIQTDTTGQLNFQIKDGGSSYIIYGPSLAPNEWAMFVCWHDDSANSMHTQLNNGTIWDKYSVSISASYSSKCVIGGGVPGSFTFDGQIGGLWFYNSVLTANNRTFLYNSGKGRYFSETMGRFETLTYHNPKYQGV